MSKRVTVYKVDEDEVVSASVCGIDAKEYVATGGWSYTDPREPEEVIEEDESEEGQEGEFEPEEGQELEEDE